MSFSLSPKLPLSLSYSSSSPSTSTSSTNVGTVFLPIEINKSQQTNTSTYPKSLYNENYYVQNRNHSQKPFAYSNSTYRIPLVCKNEKKRKELFLLTLLFPIKYQLTSVGSSGTHKQCSFFFSLPLLYLTIRFMDDRKESKTIMDNDDDSSSSRLAVIAIASSSSLFFQYLLLLYSSKAHAHASDHENNLHLYMYDANSSFSYFSFCVLPFFFSIHAVICRVKKQREEEEEKEETWTNKICSMSSDV